MNRELIKEYIEKQPQKIVKYINLTDNKIEYEHIKCPDIKIIKGDEELSRAFLLTKLVNELGYPADRIEIEHSYTAGRPHTQSSFSDVVVRDANGNAFLFIEVKSPDEYDDNQDELIEEQLFKVSALEIPEGHNVKYLVWYTTCETGNTVSDKCIIIDAEKYKTFAEWEINRNQSNELPARYGKAQRKPYIKNSSKDLETDFSNKAITKIQTELHNVLWGGGGTDDNDIFASLTNLGRVEKAYLSEH